jgi:RecA-family ATPase
MNAHARLTMLAAALDWAAKGFAVFPCRPLGKEPLGGNGHKDATTDPETIKAWWTETPDANIGVSPAHSGHFVIDVDPPRGEETLAALELEHGFLPTTFAVRTPRGGAHIWYRGRCPSSVGTEKTGLGPKLDTRGYGGYVLLSPSRVVDEAKGINGSYEIAAEGEIADGPEWIAQVIARKRDEHRAAAGTKLDFPGNVERARDLLRRYVAQNDVAIEGQGGDDRTYRLSCEVLNLGLSNARAVELIDKEWNAHCVPPWQIEELEVKVSNASEYAQNESGAWAVAPGSETFADFAASQPDDASCKTFGDLLSRTVAPVEEIIPGLIEKRIVTFLSGPGGTNKSRLAIQWGLSAHAGLAVFGRDVQRCHFVYVSYEDDEDEVARRSQKISRRLSLSDAEVADALYLDKMGKDAPFAIVHEDGTFEERPFAKELRDQLGAIAGHKLVAVDSCYNFLRFIRSAKIDEGAVNGAIGTLQRFCLECDCTVIMLWHPSQAGQERGDASGWSVAWHNAPRARLSITALKDADDAFDLKAEKRNHDRRGQTITLYWSDGVLLPRTETAAGEQKGHFMRSVVRVAIIAAEQAAPITMQKRLYGWQLDEIERDIGRRPSNTEVKEVLAAALPAGLLRYVKGSTHRAAGYYPADQMKAEELARAAKHHSSTGGDNG